MHTLAIGFLTALTTALPAPAVAAAPGTRTAPVPPATAATAVTTEQPQIVSRAPRPDAMAVSRTQNIAVGFDKKVVGVDTRTFRLGRSGGGDPIRAKVSRKGSTNQWILDPSSSLSTDTRYLVLLLGGTADIRDTDGNELVSSSWYVTTGPAPTVEDRTPSSDARNVSRSTNVTVSFSESVVDVGAATFTLRNARTGVTVPATLTLDPDTFEWILNPTTNLAGGTRYTARLVGGPEAIRDHIDNPLNTTSWSFTTRR